ncbi:hypothetical protein Fluta_3476 [Fluviicola taffensis DSM 16823]|uniref:Uncharacterized protein n=1 Tax=Fluviicola taffensis (strain DSM 16823 / NCIMB 13979 / RW262) TaxID=755732 RepID=F2ICH7_FLUTR|nr:hypothetical protein Fluta_3476 [Fluviicola taffensis DSM 16823]
MFIVLILMILLSFFLRIVCACDLFFGTNILSGLGIENVPEGSLQQAVFMYGPSVLNILVISIYYWIFRKDKIRYKSNLFVFFLFLASLDLMLSIFLFLMSDFSVGF